MSMVIRGGTIVTADLTYKSDILIEDGKIAAIGDNLTGDKVIDADGCYVMPGGIDPHTHMEMPFMGTYSEDDFESGTKAAVAGGTTMVVDFCLPAPISRCSKHCRPGTTNLPRRYVTIPSTWRSPGGRAGL